ncbi:MAG: tRNA 2-thiocytidine biosynthesis TtcA family protein, partial [Bacillota bacterium]|nr:tRNA 2-thiocytidine biosynthesis TtcA family protein [Bacillota bacterium]
MIIEVKMRYFREIMKRSAGLIKNHGLISDDNGIMVGLSGGKDSLTLLMVLAEFHKYSKYKYDLAAGYVDLGLGADYSEMASFCQNLGVPLYVEKSDIGPIVFDVRQEKNPCSLCAKMRRGALNDLAKKNGFPKVALGHHQDDYLETFFLNLFFEGRFDILKSETYLSRMDIRVIRPMLAVPEELIKKHAANVGLPVVFNPCTAD